MQLTRILGQDVKIGTEVFENDKYIGKVTKFIQGCYSAPNEKRDIEIDNFQIRSPALEAYYANRKFTFVN